MKGLERIDRIFLGVDWNNGFSAAGLVAAVQAFNFHFLNAASIRQHVGTQIDCALSGPDASLKSVLYQLWNKSTVVDMCMSEKQNIQFSRVEGKRAIVQGLYSLRSLEHAAIDQKARLAGIKKIARSRNGIGCTAKLDGRGHGDFSSMPGMSSIEIPFCSRDARRARS